MTLGTRKPYYAGQFYDGNAEDLEAYISRTAEEEMETVSSRDKVRAVILPHAGYRFSARTAIKTLLRAAEVNYSKIVVLAPSHRVPFRGAAVADYDYYQTPLGNIKVDLEAVNEIMGFEDQLLPSLSQAHQYEHALEVELPLLQHFFDGFELIPLICGAVDEKIAEQIASELKKWWQPDILWVISSDFTHYGYSFNYVPFEDNVKENLRQLDLGAVQLIVNEDLKGFCGYLEKTGVTICGAGPIKILLAVIKAVAADNKKLNAELVNYITSGDLTGDFKHCVSYAGISFFDA
ncbi:AmmeMemoRadiSam system protein B [Lentisphaerota bacterium ZTH]|nr:AmmeMemoRadiSam system protein B [Lentisphaerota bacterium]WET05866.1 AmmeMemoRadiSam system protein B [Lentisphaerota bacterium ZTH]